MSSPLHSNLSVRIHQGLGAFDELQSDWEDAVARAARPSLFVTPLYVRLTWQHFARPSDEPWLVAVRDEHEQLIGLLPLARSTDWRRGWPLRTLHHIGHWSGDRPGILCVEGSPDRIWRAALGTLLRQLPQWHRLDLREVDQDAWPAQPDNWLVSRANVMILPDTYSGVQPITGTWDEYLAGRSRNTRQSYLRRKRQLEQDFPDLRIEVIDTPEQIGAAFERYVAIERRSWKESAEIGMWAEPGEIAFHRELLPLLARTGQASVWLMSCGAGDMAGLVRLRQGGVVYERYSTFDPAYSRYSPSTRLCMEAVSRMHGTDCTESDALGLQQPLHERPCISAWYDIERRTYRVVVTHDPAPARLVHRARRIGTALQQAGEGIVRRSERDASEVHLHSAMHQGSGS